MAMGAPPYSNLPPYPAMLKITQQDPPNVPESKFSKEFRDFIRQCLIKDVKKRPRINELLKHPFLKKAKKTSHLVALITKHQQSKNNDLSEIRSSEEEDDEFEEKSFGSMIRSSANAKGKKKKTNQRDFSVEWTFGTRDGSMMSPRPYDDDVDLYDDANNGYNNLQYTPMADDDTNSGDYGDFDGGTMIRSPTDHKEKLANLSNGYKQQNEIDDDDDDETASFDGGTMVRNESPMPPINGNGNGHGHTKEIGTGTSSGTNNIYINGVKSKDRHHYGSDDSNDSLQNPTPMTPDAFDQNSTFNQIRNSMKMNGSSLIKVPKPKLKNTLSVVSYSIGIQTVPIQSFDKSTQTQNDTVSDLVGIYKDIDDLFNILNDHIDNDGQKHLESLKDKVKKLTHMKITERKTSKTESANSIKIARDRIQQIRQRRADLKQKHGKSAKTISENDTKK